MSAIIKRLPKAELHVHIEGTITPELARLKAAENGIVLPDDLFTPDGNAFAYKDFFDCVTRVYDGIASVIQNAQDYEDITYDYLKRCAAENCIYVEMIISADHCERMGIPYIEMVNAMARAIDRARDDTGIEARMNVAFIRHLPIETAWETARTIVNNPHPYVVGLDLAGAEQNGDVAQFLPVFAFIRENTNNALGWRMHTSEASGPENTWQALGAGVTRFGHGVRSVEDPKLVAALAIAGAVFEESLTSNNLAGIFAYEAHPIRQLYEAGVGICLNSDDPGLFDCSIGSEYQLAHDKFGFTPSELLSFTRTAIEAAFLDDATRAVLLQRVDTHKFGRGTRDRKPA